MDTFYYAPKTCSLASHLALERAGAPYRAERVNLAGGQQRTPEFLKVNPKGRVPALVTERGVITETPALLLYVAQQFPESGLAPLDDPFDLAQFNAFNSFLCSSVHVNHAHGLRGERWASDPAAIEAMKAHVPASMTESTRLIEETYLIGPWVLGERFSACDDYLFTIAQWLEGDGVDLGRFPKVAEHRARLSEDPVVQRVLAVLA